MFKNYLLVTFRNLLKNRVFTAINILGLGIGLSLCIVAFFNHMFNYEFDRTNENFDIIYRVNSYRDMEGREQEYGLVPATLGLEVKKDIPGIEKAARLMRTGSPVKNGLDVYPTQVSYIDPEFLDIFTFKILSGDKHSINNHADILISKTMASKLFGKEYPIGKSISIFNEKNREFSYTVGAVYDDLPLNSSFRIDILSHYDNFKLMWDWTDADWKNLTTVFFVTIPDKKNLSVIARSMNDYVPVQNRARQDFKINRFSLIPLKDVGANSRTTWASGLFPSLHPAALYAPPVMALFILLIACFNFANTSIAAFSKRTKEIGLRKTFGGQRRQLVVQFMVETLIICFLALIAGLILAEFLVPAYSSLWDYMKIELTFGKYLFFWFFLVMLLLLTGFISGVYPALHVSSFTPASVLRGTSSFKGTGKLSSLLLVLQFSISVIALVLGLVFSKNAVYQKTLDLGYDRDKLIVLPLPPELSSSFRNEILTNPQIISAEGTQNHIGFGAYRRPVKDAIKQLEVDVMDIGPGYPATMGLRLIKGRLFDKTRYAADLANKSILINEKMVSDFGWKEPLGMTISLYDTTRFTVIGVVKNFYVSGLWQKINPSMLRLSSNEQYNILAVRAEAGNLPAVLDYLKLKWKSQSTNFVFGGMFQEDTMNEEKEINNSILKVNVFLAIAALLLSLVGMYNLVSLDIIRRTKEIGIRKINGAPVPQIMFLVSRKFLIIILISSIAGCFGGYWLSLKLLDSIWDYFVAVGPGILILAASIMFAATMLTIVFKIARAALRNPVDSLRYE